MRLMKNTASWAWRNFSITGDWSSKNCFLTEDNAKHSSQISVPHRVAIGRSAKIAAEVVSVRLHNSINRKLEGFPRGPAKSQFSWRAPRRENFQLRFSSWAVRFRKTGSKQPGSSKGLVWQRKVYLCCLCVSHSLGQLWFNQLCSVWR